MDVKTVISAGGIDFEMSPTGGKQLFLLMSSNDAAPSWRAFLSVPCGCQVQVSKDIFVDRVFVGFHGSLSEKIKFLPRFAGWENKTGRRS
jgi:hypothetical protein